MQGIGACCVLAGISREASSLGLQQSHADGCAFGLKMPRGSVCREIDLCVWRLCADWFVLHLNKYGQRGAC